MPKNYLSDVLYFMFTINNIFWYLHLLINPERLLSNTPWFGNMINNKFSVKHNLRKLCFWFREAFLAISHFVIGTLMFRFSSHTFQFHCYIFHVSYLLHGCYISLWKMFQILLNKLFFIIYIAGDIYLVNNVWCKSLIFQRATGIVSTVATILVFSGLKIEWLCVDIMEFILRMQLWLVLTAFLLNILWNKCIGRKCLCKRFKKSFIDISFDIHWVWWIKPNDFTSTFASLVGMWIGWCFTNNNELFLKSASIPSSTVRFYVVVKDYYVWYSLEVFLLMDFGICFLILGEWLGLISTYIYRLPLGVLHGR